MLGVVVVVCAVCGCERWCAFGKLFSLVVVMYVGVGLVMGLQNNIGIVVDKSVGVCGSGGPTQTAISEQELRC